MIPARINYYGDRNKGGFLRRLALKQLDILHEQMIPGKLKVYQRTLRFDDGSMIICSSYPGDLNIIDISVPIILPAIPIIIPEEGEPIRIMVVRMKYVPEAYYYHYYFLVIGPNYCEEFPVLEHCTYGDVIPQPIISGDIPCNDYIDYLSSKRWDFASGGITASYDNTSGDDTALYSGSCGYGYCGGVTVSGTDWSNNAYTDVKYSGTTIAWWSNFLDIGNSITYSGTCTNCCSISTTETSILNNNLTQYSRGRTFNGSTNKVLSLFRQQTLTDIEIATKIGTDSGSDCTDPIYTLDDQNYYDYYLLDYNMHEVARVNNHVIKDAPGQTPSQLIGGFSYPDPSLSGSAAGQIGSVNVCDETSKVDIVCGAKVQRQYYYGNPEDPYYDGAFAYALTAFRDVVGDAEDYLLSEVSHNPALSDWFAANVIPWFIAQETSLPNPQTGTRSNWRVELKFIDPPYAGVF